MTFDPSIPQPTDFLDNSQGDLLTNYGQLNTQFGVNHVAFDDASADKGKHKFVTFVQQSDDPESNANEHLLYVKDDGGTPEIYARPENNGTAFQVTKEGAIFVGLIPVVAVNFNQTGAIQGNSLNVTSVTRSLNGRYRVNFTNPITDNNYFWSVSGFDNSSNVVVSQVTNSGSYGTVVKTNSISFDFKDRNAALVTSLTRASVVCWRIE